MVLHIHKWIVCSIETYQIPIYHMSKFITFNLQRYAEAFYMCNVSFDISWLSLNINHIVFMS